MTPIPPQMNLSPAQHRPDLHTIQTQCPLLLPPNASHALPCSGCGVHVCKTPGHFFFPQDTAGASEQRLVLDIGASAIKSASTWSSWMRRLTVSVGVCALTFTTCQIRHHSHLWDHHRSGYLRIWILRAISSTIQ